MSYYSVLHFDILIFSESIFNGEVQELAAREKTKEQMQKSFASMAKDPLYAAREKEMEPVLLFYPFQLLEAVPLVARKNE